MPKRPTMADVARRAGISKATVSRAIHTPQMVQPATLARVQRAITEAGYIYDSLAGDFSRQRTSVLGLIVPTIRASIFALSSLGIQEAAQAEGYAVLIANSNYDLRAEADLIRLFLRRRVAGLILTGWEPELAPLAREIAAQGTPCVITWQALDHPELSSVGFDNRRAARQATDYLLSLKHRRIGLICGPREVGRARQRHEGYQEALAAQGVPYDPALVFSRHYRALEGKEAMQRLLALPDPPSAVFAASDILAMGALSAAWEAGLKVPGDISLVGFDDSDFAAHCQPPLSTVRVPAHEMGALAARQVIAQARGREAGPRHYNLATDLIVRASCREYSAGRRRLSPTSPEKEPKA